MEFISRDPCSWRRYGSPHGGFLDPNRVFSTWSHDGKTEDSGNQFAVNPQILEFASYENSVPRKPEF